MQSYLREQEKNLKQSNLTFKATRERRKNKTQKVSRRKEIIKIRAEINERSKNSNRFLNFSFLFFIASI